MTFYSSLNIFFKVSQRSIEILGQHYELTLKQVYIFAGENTFVKLPESQLVYNNISSLISIEAFRHSYTFSF